MILHPKKLLIVLLLFPFFLFAQEQPEETPADLNIFIEEKPVDNEAAGESAVADESSASRKYDSDKKVDEKKKGRKDKKKTRDGFELVDSKEIIEDSPELPLVDETKYSLVEMYGDRPEVEYWRNIYLSEKWQKILRGILENAVEYRIYVRNCVSQRDVPLELEYLPVVESGYKTSVRSRSGAIGMWQFMANSVRPFLKLNEYVDERYDPWLSTQAGISKLQDNYRIFNDWLIAIAAYNCGNGAMTRSIKKAKTNDYWLLAEKKAMPKQTAEYIPKLIAIADIATNPEKYSIDLPHHDKEYEELVQARDAAFDYVKVRKPYMMAAIAKESGISEKTLKHLNPALTKGFTPPAAEYEIRLPLGSKESVENAIAKIRPIEFPFKYTVVKGDSLWSISRKFGVTVQALCDTNGIKENAILKIGKVLYIPSSKK